MKFGVLYKIVHGLADFPSIPISARDNPFALRHLNPQKRSQFAGCKDKKLEVLFYPRFCETLELNMALTNFNFMFELYNIISLDGYIPLGMRLDVWLVSYW